MAKSILLINGPNLNLLGTRETSIYGTDSLDDIVHAAREQCTSLDPPVKLDHFQSNHEGQIIDRIHRARVDGTDAIVINAAGLTHTSVVVRDALTGVAIPFIEVHISNVHAREGFRRQSFLSEKAAAVVCGLGSYGYTAAIDFAAKHMKVKR